MSLPSREGFIPFRGYRTWYHIVGDLNNTSEGIFPLLCLHGGPGIPHDSLEPLEKLAETGRPVVFYDQLGCGNSDHPDDPELWSLELFLDELVTLRRTLALDQIHLLGHSWGGVLAMAYVLTQPKGILSLILNCTVVDWPLLDVEQPRFRAQAMPEVYEIMQKFEQKGDYFAPEYQKARREFDKQHCCRLEPWPDFLERAIERANWQVNMSLSPKLKGWNVCPRLDEIRTPVLITTGRHDGYVPLSQGQLLYEGLPKAKLVCFEDSSHYPHAEEAETYRAVLNDFLDQVDQGLIDA
jgi:proline-specific peptidase